MKWLLRLAFPALGVLLLLIFFGLNDPTEPVEETDQGAVAEEIPAFEGLVPSPVATEGPDIVFKWRDSDGGWHYADTPPKAGQWNALAIERADEPVRSNSGIESSTDWQSPYTAPFSMGPASTNNDS